MTNPAMAKKRPSWAFWVLAGAISLYALWGTAHIPFHPDESTQLFMSSDFDMLFANPLSMAWEPGKEADLRTHYRLIDAPLTRYLLGLGRSIAGLPPLPVDWDWTLSWEENRIAGALPQEQLLQTGRLTVTLLLPLSLLFIYLIGREIGGEASGLLAVLLLGSNALTLLHGRRAMAEGALTLGAVFALWSFLQAERRPWLAGLGMALAFNAKHSALALLPVGLLAAAWGPFNPQAGALADRLKRALVNVSIYGAVFASLTLFMNPFLWRDPIGAVQVSLRERRALLDRQLADTLKLAPEKALLTPAQRGMALLANLLIVPPAFAETNQYHPYTAYAEQRYLSLPGHNLLRSLQGAGVTLGLFLFGVALALVDFRKLRLEQRRALALLALATVSQAALLILTVPLTWQRYVIPLTPLVCLWSAYPLARLRRRA